MRKIRFGTLDFGEKEPNAIKELIDVDEPQLTMGRKVQEFEQKFASWLGVKYAVMVNSGTRALLTALSTYDSKEHMTTALKYASALELQ
jgi:CDP-6-deoxy-D-xylo-4-hexulose-3-dehydrase